MKVYRPWGHIDWLITRLGEEGWSLLACNGTEERSAGFACHFGRRRFGYARIVSIRDPEPLSQAAFDARLAERRSNFLDAGFSESEIKDAPLLESLEQIRGHIDALVDAGARRLIVDITSFPKRWFFALLQAALENDRLSDVVATYTSSTDYAELLSSNIGPLRALPGFYAEDGRTEHGSIIVGIGFDPSPLVPLLQDHQARKIRLIFPFPPGPPGHRRNWMFVKQIESLTESEEIDPPDRVHIHMYDCPQVFDALAEMTRGGNDTSALAPYGPKTVSLAMCLFSLAASRHGKPRVPIFYAQPKRYALDYTTGIARCGNVAEVTGYCLRVGGQNLYDLS